MEGSLSHLLSGVTEFFAVEMFVIFQFVPSSLLYRVFVKNFVSFWEKTQSLQLPVAGMKPLNKCIHWTDATEVPRKRSSRGIYCPLGFPDQQSAILGLRWWCAVLHTLCEWRVTETAGMSLPDTYQQSGWPQGHVCPVYKDPVPRILTINSWFHFSSFAKT